MNRRQFLKTCGALLSGVAVTTSVIANPRLFGRLKKWLSGCRCKNGVLCSKCKELIISKALESPEGREALAQSMVEPIRRSLNYQAIGRKLLVVNEIPFSQ